MTEGFDTDLAPATALRAVLALLAGFAAAARLVGEGGGLRDLDAGLGFGSFEVTEGGGLGGTALDVVILPRKEESR